MNKLIISLIVISVLSACDSGNSVQITDSCYIDSPSNGAKLATSQDLLISGWAFDKQSANSPEQVSVQLNGESIHPFKAVRVKRPDVVKAFNTPGAEMSGYNAIVPANTLTAGQYEVVVMQEMPEKKLKCSRQHVIEITGEVVATPAPVAVPVVIAPPEAASIKPKAATLVTKEIKVTDKVAKTSKQKTKTSKVPNKAAKKQKSDQ
jgi:uncharacterized protein with GYD domain